MFTYVISIICNASVLVSDHNITLWMLETRDCGDDVICRPTLSMTDSVHTWQQWFTEETGRSLRRKWFIPVGSTIKIQQGCSEFTSTYVSWEFIACQKSKWLDSICDSAQVDWKKFGCYAHELSKRYDQTCMCGTKFEWHDLISLK